MITPLKLFGPPDNLGGLGYKKRVDFASTRFSIILPRL